MGTAQSLPQPNPAPAVASASRKRNKADEVDVVLSRFRPVPQWVMDLVRKEAGTDVRFIAEKTIESSDLNPQQNRFYIPIDFVEANLVPALSESEKAAASLVGDGRKRSRPSGAGVEEGELEEGPTGRKKAKTMGREHGGLPVTVFTRSGFRCFLSLTRWDGSRGTVMKGKELKIFKAWSSLKSGDEVETWAFRRQGDEYLCFAVGKKSSSPPPPSSSSSSSCLTRQFM